MEADLEIISELTEDDVLGLAELMYIRDTEFLGKVGVKAKENDCFDRAFRFNEDCSRHLWMAKNSGINVAYGRAKQTDNSLRGEMIFVVHNYRGRGYGAMLLKAQLQFARKHDIPEITSCIALDNERSIRMSRSAGFKMDYTLDGYIVHRPVDITKKV